MRSIFVRNEITLNSYISGVLVTLGEKIVTCVIFLVRTWFTFPFHAKIVHFFFFKMLLDYFFPLHIKPVKLLSKHYPQNFDPCWILFICLYVSVCISHVNKNTNTCHIKTWILNEVKKDFVHFVLQGHIFKVMTSLHSRHQSFWGFF